MIGNENIYWFQYRFFNHAMIYTHIHEIINLRLAEFIGGLVEKNTFSLALYYNVE